MTFEGAIAFRKFAKHSPTNLFFPLTPTIGLVARVGHHVLAEHEKQDAQSQEEFG